MEALDKLTSRYYRRAYGHRRHMDDYMERLPMDYIRRHTKFVKALVLALKIGLGSALAILLAKLFGLSNAVSAGTITLLTLSNSKKGTLSLIGQRFLSFGVSVILCVILFRMISDDYVAYMMFLFALAFVCELLGWGKTMSVNAVIGAHFFDQMTFDVPFLLNEFWLIALSVGIAFFFNMFYAYDSMRLHMFACRITSEKNLQESLMGVADYLDDRISLHELEAKLEKAEHEDEKGLKDARDYAGNFYSRAPGAFIHYFQMRIRQETLLRSVTKDLRELKEVPCQAQSIAQYIKKITPLTARLVLPHAQEKALSRVETLMEETESEGDACGCGDKSDYHHILYVLKDLLQLKTDFMHSLGPDEVNLFFKDLS